MSFAISLEYTFIFHLNSLVVEIFMRSINRPINRYIFLDNVNCLSLCLFLVDSIILFSLTWKHLPTWNCAYNLAMMNILLGIYIIYT